MLDAAAIRGTKNAVPSAATSGFVRTKATSYYGYDLWAGTTGGPDGSRAVMIRLGWQPFSLPSATGSGRPGRPKASKDQPLLLTAEVAATDLTGLSRKAAAGRGSSQQLHYCAQGDGGPGNATHLPAFTDCSDWQPGSSSVLGDLQLACSPCQGPSCRDLAQPTAEEAFLVARDQQVQQALIDFQVQRQTAVVTSSVLVAAVATGSAGASAIVSGFLAQAAASLSAIGGLVGVQGAASSIGIGRLVNHLQMFSLSGG